MSIFDFRQHARRQLRLLGEGGNCQVEALARTTHLLANRNFQRLDTMLLVRQLVSFRIVILVGHCRLLKSRLATYQTSADELLQPLHCIRLISIDKLILYKKY